MTLRDECEVLLDARSMPTDSRTPQTCLLLVVLLIFGVGSATWSADASAEPVTAPDAATTPEDRDIDVRPLSNDFDTTICFGGVPCNLPLVTIASVTQPANGTVVVHQGPGLQPDFVTYTPRNNFFGTDTFTYTALGFVAPVESQPTTVTITVTPVNDAPNAVDDSATTGQGRAVTISVLANDTDIEGDPLTIASVTNPNHGTAAIAGTAVTYTPDPGFSGTDRFDYRARDGEANSAPATVTVVVTPNVAPTARITGGNRTVPDSDHVVGEDVHLDGSTSSDPDGTIASYMWFNQQQPIGSGPTIDVRLPDGDSVIRLVVTDDDGATGSSTATISIATPPPRTSLQSLPDLTPNQRSVAVALDDLCLRLTQQPTLTEGESDLLARCNGIVFDNDPARQTTAVSELGAEDLNALKTQTMLLARDLSVGVMDRLMALRSGAEGLSAASGLSLLVDGKPVPPDMLKLAADEVVGEPAKDDREPLFSDRWGFWMRGNFGSSEKDSSSTDSGFDADQWGISGGVDYRVPEEQAMVGLALAVGQSDASFKPSGEGGVDTSAWSLSLYGGLYPADGLFYADGFLSYGHSSFDSKRHIHYVDADGTIDRTAQGSSDGSMLSAGVSAGHDFLIGQVTVSPNARLYFLDATVNGFQESGASGLDLVYQKQDFESATASLGVRITAAWNFGWIVLLPHFRADAVWEFRDAVNAFGVRFANDPFAGTANPTPPIVVTSEAPDQSFMLFAVGMAAQLRYGVSAYVEYQTLQGLEFLTVSDVALGMRVQYSFR
jgi:outer membrane autotransporter protein